MRTTTLLTSLAAPLALAACDSGQDMAEMNDMPMAEDGMMMDDQDMSAMDPGDMMQTASAEGTVTAIDGEAGTITVEHGPVAAIDWPAMTMPFAVEDPAQLQSLERGERVEFVFVQEATGPRIVSIRESGQ